MQTMVGVEHLASMLVRPDGPTYAASVHSEVRLRLYGQVSDKPALEWSWVNEQLERAGTYWVIARTAGHPHPRPVWGVWEGQRLFLSIGTPPTVRALTADPRVTVHLDSGTDVVIVEGRTVDRTQGDHAIEKYDRKYDWSYDGAVYGPLTVILPTTVLAWRTAGWAGRDSFQQTGRWEFR
ncbi:hypothetical protein [Mycobacterium antarcticum]